MGGNDHEGHIVAYIISGHLDNLQVRNSSVLDKRAATDSKQKNIDEQRPRSMVADFLVIKELFRVFMILDMLQCLYRNIQNSSKGAEQRYT